MSVKRYTSQTSFDGLSHRMVEFEHGEYVRYYDYHRAVERTVDLEHALMKALNALNKSGTIWARESDDASK